MLWNSLFFPLLPFFIFAIQKSGGPWPLSATLVLSDQFGIIRRRVSLFILSLNSFDPYSRVFNRDSPSKLITEGSIRKRSSWRLCISLARDCRLRATDRHFHPIFLIRFVRLEMQYQVPYDLLHKPQKPKLHKKLTVPRCV